MWRMNKNVLMLGYLNSNINMEIPKMNLEEVKITSMNCFFSEVSEVAADPPTSYEARQPLNCHAAYDS